MRTVRLCPRVEQLAGVASAGADASRGGRRLRRGQGERLSDLREQAEELALLAR
jgi:hypothetical protein